MNSRWIHASLALVMMLAQMKGWSGTSAETLERGVYQEETAGNVAEAIQIYAGLVKEEQVNRVVVAEAMYRLGRCYQKSGDAHKARQTFDQLVTQLPEQSKYVELARKELAALPGGNTPEEKTKEAELKAKQAQLAAKPMQFDAQDRKLKSEEESVLGWQLWNARKLADAEARFKKAVETDPENANAWNGLGWSQSNQGKFLAAAQAFKECIKLEPKHAPALNGLGWCAKAQGQIDEAISWWERAVAASPQATAALNGLVTTYIEQKNHSKAIEYCEQWLKQEPNSPEATAQLKYAKALASGDKNAEAMPVDGKYTPQKVRSADADYFFKYLGREPEPGFHQFAAMWALTDKGKLGETTVTDAIIERARQLLESKDTGVARWHACYVLSGIEDLRVIPILAKTLRESTDETVRGVAACALGSFKQREARSALEEAAKTEKAQSVREWIDKALSGQFIKHSPDKTDDVKSTATQAEATPATSNIGNGDLRGQLVDRCVERMKELKDRQITQRNIAWLDKNDIVDVYEQWARTAPSREEKEAQVAVVKEYLARTQSDPFHAWRLNHLLAAASLDLGRPDEAALYLDKALATYSPATDYAEPAKQSKYHHIVHERTQLIWQKDGVEAAEKYFLDKLARDPNCEYFHSSFWENQYKQTNQQARLRPFLDQVAAAYAERERIFPDTANQTANYRKRLIEEQRLLAEVERPR